MFHTTSKSGKPVTLLTPAEKGKKYAEELRTGKKRTNDGKLKTDNGKPVELTEEERRYRIGYLNSRKDDANAWKSKERKKKEEKERKKQEKAAKKAAK